jgi:hypothetical protein
MSIPTLSTRSAAKLSEQNELMTKRGEARKKGEKRREKKRKEKKAREKERKKRARGDETCKIARTRGRKREH